MLVLFCCPYNNSNNDLLYYCIVLMIFWSMIYWCYFSLFRFFNWHDSDEGPSQMGSWTAILDNMYGTSGQLCHTSQLSTRDYAVWFLWVFFCLLSSFVLLFCLLKFEYSSVLSLMFVWQPSRESYENYWILRNWKNNQRNQKRCLSASQYLLILVTEH